MVADSLAKAASCSQHSGTPRLARTHLMRHSCWINLVIAVALASTAQVAAAGTATINVTQSQVGVTPQYISYNMRHYLPGSNTSAWVDHSGINAFRVWLSPGDCEPTDDGAVGENDYNIWRSHVGLSVASSFALTAVPEPASLISMLVALAAPWQTARGRGC